jgi:hypothetical protein
VSRFGRRRRDTAPEGLVPAEQLARLRRPAAPEGAPPDPALLERQDRLVEAFALLQSDLGGLYYEMAIRDSVRPELLARKAAELQRVDVELRGIERLLRSGDAPAAVACRSCGSPAGQADAFCAHCGSPLGAGLNGAAA